VSPTTKNDEKPATNSWINKARTIVFSRDNERTSRRAMTTRGSRSHDGRSRKAGHHHDVVEEMDTDRAAKGEDV
jgi:hypothetical protein